MESWVLTHAKVKVTAFSFSLTKAGWDDCVCGTKDAVCNVSGNVPSDISRLFITSIQGGKNFAWMFTLFL